MILSKLLSNKLARKPSPARVLYEAIVAAARRTEFYEEMSVPDTVDGRFDMIVLHMFLVLDKLKAGEAADMQQELTDEFFKDMDRSLREMGVGDLSVGKKVRKMAEAYQGRILAYHAAADESDVQLVEALRLNVYAGVNPDGAERLAAWVRKAQAGLVGQNIDHVCKGRVSL
jgi:cytochrome b pre-mRNA-processing protein 3